MYKARVKTLFIALICLPGIICWTACNKVENLLKFKIRNGVTFEIPSAIGINVPYTVPVPDVETNASQTFKNNNTDINKVKDIKLETLDLTITSPENASFKPVKSIRIYIVSDGLPEKLLAFKDDIPATIGNKLSLETSRENLDTYVKKETYSLRTETVLREAVFQDTQIYADVTFAVTANF